MPSDYGQIILWCWATFDFVSRMVRANWGWWWCFCVTKWPLSPGSFEPLQCQLAIPETLWSLHILMQIWLFTFGCPGHDHDPCWLRGFPAVFRREALPDFMTGGRWIKSAGRNADISSHSYSSSGLDLKSTQSQLNSLQIILPHPSVVMATTSLH